MTHQSKTCTACREEKPTSEFYIRNEKGRAYFKSLCKKCDGVRRSKYRRDSADPIKNTLRAERAKKKKRDERRDNIDPGKYILKDCRSSDKKKGRIGDLDRSFIDTMISKPCSYCGDINNKMTLDRIDNDLGHLKSNVVPACYRCNLFRGNMPYQAWICFSPVLKEVRLAGKMDGWNEKPIATLSDTERTVRDERVNTLANKVTAHPRKSQAGIWQKASDEEYLAALQKYPSISQALTSLGLAPKGKNYERAKRLLGIPKGTKLKTRSHIIQEGKKISNYPKDDLPL